MVIAFAVEILCHLARLYMLVRSIEFPMLQFLKDVTVRVYFVTALAFILPLIVYEEIELMVLRFILVCITLMFGYYLGFGEADRVKIKTKIVSIIKNKFHKK